MYAAALLDSGKVCVNISDTNGWSTSFTLSELAPSQPVFKTDVVSSCPAKKESSLVIAVSEHDECPAVEQPCQALKLE